MGDEFFDVIFGWLYYLVVFVVVFMVFLCLCIFVSDLGEMMFVMLWYELFLL